MTTYSFSYPDGSTGTVTGQPRQRFILVGKKQNKDPWENGCLVLKKDITLKQVISCIQDNGWNYVQFATLVIPGAKVA